MKTQRIILLLLVLSISIQAKCLFLKKMSTSFSLEQYCSIPNSILSNTYDEVKVINSQITLITPQIIIVQDIQPTNLDENIWGRINQDYIHNPKFWIKTGCIVLYGSAQMNVVYVRSKWKTFEKVYPNANPAFWRTGISANNKYKNGDPEQGPKFPGSTNILSPFTDGYHLFTGIGNVFLGTSLVVNIYDHRHSKRKFMEYVFEAGCYGLANWLGMTITSFTYDTIAKNR